MTPLRPILGLVALFALALPLQAQIPGTGATESAQAVNQRFLRAYQARNWTEAIAAGKRLIELESTNATHPYNLACVYSRAGQLDDAISSLRQSAKLGYSDFGLWLLDADLYAVHEHAGFQEVLALTRGNWERQRTDFVMRVKESRPLVVTPPEHDPEKPSGLLMVLHGVGGSAEDIAEIYKPLAAERGMILVAPRGAVSLAGSASWGTVDEAQYQVRHTLDTLATEHAIDPARTVLAGFSQGGQRSINVGMRLREDVAGVISVAGSYDSQLVALPTSEETTLPRMVLFMGSLDSTVVGTRTAAETQARAAGITERVQVRVFQGVGHTYPPERVTELGKALDFVLGQAAAAEPQAAEAAAPR